MCCSYGLLPERPPTDCAESTTYYKLEEGSHDTEGNYLYRVSSSTVPQTLSDNVCEFTPAPSGYGSLPTNCSKDCYPADGGGGREAE